MSLRVKIHVRIHRFSFNLSDDAICLFESVINCVIYLAWIFIMVCHLRICVVSPIGFVFSYTICLWVCLISEVIPLLSVFVCVASTFSFSTPVNLTSSFFSPFLPGYILFSSVLRFVCMNLLSYFEFNLVFFMSLPLLSFPSCWVGEYTFILFKFDFFFFFLFCLFMKICVHLFILFLYLSL